MDEKRGSGLCYINSHTVTNPGVPPMQLFNGVHKVAVMAPRRSNSNGVHFVTVPEEWGEGREFRIKVSAVDDPSVFAFSPAFLAILPSKVRPCEALTIVADTHCASHVTTGRGEAARTTGSATGRKTESSRKEAAGYHV